MSDAWPHATITSFEQVPVASTVTLLRIAATTTGELDSDQSRPVLVTDVEGTSSRHVPIPAPPDTDGELRAAYSVSEELVANATAYSLQCADGSVLALPAPTVGSRRSHPRTAAPQSLEDAGERRSALAPKLAELTEELADARHAVDLHRSDTHAAREAQTRLHLECAELRAELTAMGDLARLAGTGDGESASADLEIWAAELERRLAETTTELSTMRESAGRDGAELQRLRGQLADAQTHLEDARAELVSLREKRGAA